jgi:glutamate dehydrogenase
LRNRRTNLDPSVDVPFFATAIVELSQHMQEVLQNAELARWQETYDRCTELGLSERFARVAALPGNLYSGLGVIEAARVSKADMKTVAHVFFYLSDRLTLNWFSKQISEVSVETFWQAMARESFLDDMESCIRSLTISFINLRPADKTMDETFARWTEACQELFDRWNLMMLELQSSNTTDFAMFSVAMRELSDLAQASADCAPLFEGDADQTGAEQEQGIA